MNNEEADKAFARLEELLKRLPLIQGEDARLTHARQARELREAARLKQHLEKEVYGYERMRDQAFCDARTASKMDDTVSESRNLELFRIYSDLYSTRLAPFQRAENALFEALRQSPLCLDDPLDEYALTDEEYTALETGIRAYQEEYLETYKLCQQIQELL